ncbi:hypothetical protein Esti_006881 [Eimeria stiedai]
MNRVKSTATQEPVDLESNSLLPASSGKSHGSSHTDCLRGGISRKSGAGPSGAHGTSPHRLKSTLHIQRPRGSLRKGMQRRRLAGGGEDSEDGDDEGGPPSPDLINLCLELGTWTPSDPSPGNPRSSPAMVESYLTSLEQSVEQPPAQPSPPATAPSLSQLVLAEQRSGDKRPLDDGDSDDEAAPGPSWKVARIRAPSVSGQGSSSQTAASSSALPSSGGLVSTPSGPSAGVAPPQASGSGPHPQHPFVRLPTLEPGVKVRRFLPREMRTSGTFSNAYAATILRMRKVLRKKQLTEAQARELVSDAERLANSAYHWMRFEVQGLPPRQAATHLGQRFLVIYYLFCASKVLGQEWTRQGWWPELMDRIPHLYEYDIESMPSASAFYVSLAKDLALAMQQLKNGVSLSANFIIDLKRRLICTSQSPPAFRKRQWDPWRQDDEESQG